MIDRLLTERLMLRPITVDDVDLLVALNRDPEVMRYLTGGRPSTRDDVAQYVPRHLGTRWMAFDRATGEFVGWFGLGATGDGEHGEVEYELLRADWEALKPGRGSA